MASSDPDDPPPGHTSYCDCCHEFWPPDFFCEICSREPELVETRQPVAFWDYSPMSDQFETVEEYVFRSVCVNCCRGHKKRETP